MKRAWIVSAAVAGTFLLLTWSLNRDNGLRRQTVTAASGSAADRWTGAWNVPGAGPYDLALEGRGPSSWKIDGHVVNEVANGAAGSTRTIWLTSGFHSIEITHEPDPASPYFAFAAAPAGDRPLPLSRSAVKPKPPRNPVLRRIGGIVQAILGWVLVASIVVAVRRTAEVIGARWPGQISEFGKAYGHTAAWAALAIILIFAALLRLDAITARLADADPLVLVVMHGALVPASRLFLRLAFPVQVGYLHVTRYRGSKYGGRLKWIARPPVAYVPLLTSTSAPICVAASIALWMFVAAVAQLVKGAAGDGLPSRT